jgi:hypothetical protein
MSGLFAGSTLGGLISPSFNPAASDPGANFADAFMRGGKLDIDLLAKGLGQLTGKDPAYAAQIFESLSPQFKQLTPSDQGTFERLFNAEIANAAPDKGKGQQPGLGTKDPLVPFSETSNITWDTWLANIKAAPKGSPDNIRYTEMVRFAGTTNTVVLKMIMEEAHTARPTFGEVRENKTASTGPLSGFEIRYRMGADRDQALSNARAEIAILAPAIRQLEALPNPTASNKAEAAALRSLLQPAMNRYALASDNPSALRQSNLVSGAGFADNLIIAESYRKAGDALASDKGGRQGLDGNIAEAATRIRSVSSPEQYDAYIDRSISGASVKYIPASVTSPEQRANIIGQLGIGRERATLEIAVPLHDATSPFSFKGKEERANAYVADQTFRVGNNVIEQSMLAGMSKADKDAMKWGATAAIGREFYGDTLGMMTGGMAGALARAAGKPVRITAESLDTKGLFMGTHNAGPNTPRFDKWIKDGGLIELMPGGRIRYIRIINGKALDNIPKFRNFAPLDKLAPLELFTPQQIQRVGYTGKLDYVVLESGELVTGRSGHISLARGADVLAAGEARFFKGEVKRIDNMSGHYRPMGPSVKSEAEAAFNRSGFNATERYVERKF